ncbi:NADH-quinone oxidoreductase subunit K [Candidatus Bathyarchaeota archaeon]|nr:NADH-quinone oxidoreductase subunit K [Candidatus Bathyarchaeota archaeon]
MNYIVLSLMLLAVGFYGLLSKRSFLKMIVSIEIIATAATMNFVLLSSYVNKALGEALLILAFSTDTCVNAVILSLLVITAKKYGKRDIGKLAELEKRENREVDK